MRRILKNMATTNITTDERGTPGRVEANLNVAVRQGRIACRDLEKWRRTYQMPRLREDDKAAARQRAGPQPSG